ncbi:MAG: hypothetical protein [Bacteriophage sp.]|nr:MAG: hypothetical protein [Bacteriophage sp.]UVY49378.1 MAG: hypothetical protein [Bacteriophage sp.]
MPFSVILLLLTEIVTPFAVCSVSSSDVRLMLVDVLSKESFAIIFADAVSIAAFVSSIRFSIFVLFSLILTTL